MKVFISYFYQVRFFTKDTIPFSTALWDPKWYHEFQDQSHQFFDRNGVLNGFRVPILAPDESCNGLCRGADLCSTKDPNTCEFFKFYRKQLDSINLHNLLQSLEYIAKMYSNDPTIVLLVHEAPNNPCSERVVLQQWFKDNGLELKEWTRNDSVRVGIQTVPFVPLCPECNNRMEIAWFLEDEYKVTDGIRHPTGRHRMNANYLECPECLHKEPVDDDTFAKPWEK